MTIDMTIDRTMTATIQNTDPHQKQKIYGVSIASMIESIIFLALYSVITHDIIRYGIPLQKPWSSERLALQSAMNTCAIMIAVSALRFLVALALLKKSYRTAIIFYVATAVGIIINLVTGLMGISHDFYTHDIGVATLCVIGLHVAYLILMHGVIKKMREELMGDILSLPGHSPYGRPMKTATFTVPQGQNIHNRYIHGSLPPPYTTHSSGPNMDPYLTQSYPQAPPSYAVQLENGPDGPRKVVIMNSY